MKARLLVASMSVAAAALLCISGLQGCGGGVKAASQSAGVISASIDPQKLAASSPALVALGKTTYEKQCAACHGAKGDGNGEAAYLLYPKPRDFTSGEFRLISTWEGVPTDEDLFRTISRGMPGSAMPSWAHLPEETRWGLVHYLKSFAKKSLNVPPPREPSGPGDVGAGVISIPPEPAASAAGYARTRELFSKGCAPCHGETGKGDGATEQRDSKGFPTRPRDLTTGVFKGSPDPERVYRRIVAGLPGSPMPQSSYLHGDDGWRLTRYILGLSSEQQREKVEMKQYRILARKVRALPAHPDDGVWNDVEAVSLHLMPLWWRPERPETISIKAVHDGNELAMLLLWSDDTDDHTAMRPQDFRDAAAAEFALGPDPPFFAMGQAGIPVNIWMWKSERQADMQPVFQDLDKIYPNIGIDSYPNLLKSPLEQPTRNALTLQSDPTFVTAWGAGNIVADPTRKSAAEDLRAEGFGTLKARPKVDQQVAATGAYSIGSYRVAFRRSLSKRSADGVALVPGSSVPVAFAVWNGSAGDRDGKKSVTIWQELAIE